ncbi:pyridoxal phosphate-dependent aminotransferase [Oceaniglobus indicus]|uniref:pyridoxal phosphate-dependent aminotransferase n=1 Tax=Oceaniglobus indicus TaxID=2047749 RepID=UPI000C17C43D|nr:pyridoxal phosphate-dependent aminotransferase [Oceaniglobus indicus]
MELSRRITGILPEGSDGWEVFIRARAMADAGHDITELTIGEHDIGTDPAILSAMDRAARGGATGYASVPGIPALRRAVADRVAARTGVPTGPENVMIMPGGQAALFASHLAVGDPGDTALYVDPHYTTYPGVIRSLGLNPVAIPTTPEDDFQPRRAAIDARADGAKSLLINSPNNPTGSIYGRDTLDAVAGAVRDHDLWLISDEVYDTQVWSGEHISPRALPDMAARTMVIGSMSKSHAMTGSRCGWIVAEPDVIGHLINLATNTTYGVPGFIQEAAVFALAQGADLEDKVAEPFRRRRGLVQDILKGQNAVRAIPARGAMYVMLDVRSTGLSGRAFADRLLDTHAIAVMPGESYGKCAAGHVRVAMTAEDDRFAAALKTLVAFAGELS